MALVDVISKGLRLANENDSSVGSFEERSKIVGASDIGNCLKKSFLQKTIPLDYSLEQLIIFQRGHLFENIIIKAFDSLNLKYNYQLALTSSQYPYIKVHLDFCFYGKNECVVVEVKSSNSLPDTIRESWLLQLQLQMYLVRENYGRDVRGIVLVGDINTGKLKSFEIEYNETLVEVALLRAKKLYEAINTNEVPQGETSVLCSYCPFKTECEEFLNGAIEDFDLVELVKHIQELEESKKNIEEKLKKEKAELQNLLNEKKLNKIQVDNFIVTLTSDSSYQTLDIAKLKKQNPDLWNELVSNYGKQINRKGSLKIK